MTTPRLAAAIVAATLTLAVSPAFAVGDAAVGADVFKKQCTTCHSNKAGEHKTGPSLSGVYGRKAGSTDFPRYKGLVGATFVWDTPLLTEYLKDPKAFVLAHTENKTSAMTWKVRDDADTANVIAYLQTLK